MAIIPVLFVFMISISSEESIRVSGYSFVPQSFSNSAYMFLWNERATILSALWISVLVTVSGTVLGLALTTTMGYVLSRPGFKLKGFYTWVVFIPMIFNGGMVASYVVNANILNMKNTIWALIIPKIAVAYNFFLVKQFCEQLPDSILEAARIDGCSHLRIYLKIALPLSTSILVAMGILTVLYAWNDLLWPIIVTSSDKSRVLSVFIAAIKGEHNNKLPLLMAGGTLSVMPMIVCFILGQKYFVTAITMTGLKD